MAMLLATDGTRIEHGKDRDQESLPVDLIRTTIPQFVRGVRELSPLSPVFGGEGLGVRGWFSQYCPLTPTLSPEDGGEGA